MAIQSNGIAYLLAGSGTSAGFTAPEYTISFFLRVDSLTGNYGRGYVFAFGLDWYFYAYKDPNQPAGTFVAAGVERDGKTVWDEAHVARLPVGTVCHVTLSYSATDPSRRFLDVNGRRAVGDAWADFTGNTIFNAPLELFNAHYEVGAPFPSYLTVEHMLLIDRALTDEEIEAVRGNPAATIPALAPNTKKLYYSLTGNVGADVATGDPGISIAGDPTRNLSVVPGAGSTLKYVTSIPYRQATAIDECYVSTSGKALVMTCVNLDTNQPTSLGASDLAGMGTLSIRVNGGPPIVLDPPSSPHTNHHPEVGSFFWLLPAGVVVRPGDVVTMDASANWLMSTAGALPSLASHPVDNRVGKVSTRASDGQIRPGVNTTSTMATCYSWSRWAANVAKAMEVKTVDVWEDGTPKAPFNLVAFIHSAANMADGFGYSADSLLGLWLLAWECDDLANPVTDLWVECALHGFRLNEVPGYANTITTDSGQRRVKVFEMTRHRWDCTLNAAISATSDTIVVTSPGEVGMGYAPYPPDVILLTIDGEDIQCTGATCVGNVTTLTGCVRGYRGTKAVGHPPGAAATLRTTLDNIQINMRSNQDASRRFKAVRLYSPGNWPIPVPSQPEPLVVGDEDHYQLDKSFREEFLSHGLGVVRSMETAGAMEDYIYEVEDATKASDPFWNSLKPQNWTFSGVEPFDPAEKPTYAYFNRQEPETETYTATLAEAADAAATSLRITTADGSRLIAGQSLFIGSERIRVVRPCAVGDNLYPVVRGRFETTPTAHAAGSPITVGWRKLIDNVAQYGLPDASRNNMSLHRSKLILDEANSVSPLVSGIFTAAYDIATVPDDLNILARRGLTLTAALAPTDLVIHASAASPGDWAWIQPGGYVTFGGERMMVSATDQVAGTITVLGRSGSSAVLASGSPGNHTSNGILYQNDDGSIKRYVTMFTEGTGLIALSPTEALMRVSSGYDLPDPGVCLHVAVDQPFEPNSCHRRNTADPLVARSPNGNFPVDFVASVVAAGSKPGKPCHAWLNLPYGCSDDYIYEAAKTFRDALPAGAKLRLGNSNEVWNFTINRSYMTGRAFAWTLGIDDPVKHHFLSAFRIARVARECFAKAGREDDVVCMIEWHFGNMGAIRDLLYELEADGYDLTPPLGSICDANYTAPGNFAGADQLAALDATFQAADDDAAIDLFLYDTEYNPALVYPRDNAIQVRDALNSHFDWKVTRDHYEAGIEAFAPLPEPSTPSDRLGRYLRALDIISHPNTYWYELGLWEIYRRRYETTVLPVFCYGRPSGYEPDRHGQKLWGLKWYNGHKGGRGDGSGGGVDNRLRLYRPGQPNSVDLRFDSPAQHNVSVRTAAFQAKSDAFFAAAPPSPGFKLLADGVSFTWTFPEPVTWAGEGVFRIFSDGAPVGKALPPAGSGSNVLTFTLDRPVAGGATLTVEADPGLVKTVAGGTPSAGAAGGSVVNDSTWTPDGGGDVDRLRDDFSDGDLAGWTTPRGRWTVVGGKATYDPAGSENTAADVLAQSLPAGLGTRWMMAATVDFSEYVVTARLGTGNTADGYNTGVFVSAAADADSKLRMYLGLWKPGDSLVYNVSDTSRDLSSPVRLELWMPRQDQYAAAVYSIVDGEAEATPRFVLGLSGTGRPAFDSICFRPYGACSVDDVEAAATAPTRMVYVQGDDAADNGFEALAPLLGMDYKLYNNPAYLASISSSLSTWDWFTGPILAAEPTLPITFLIQVGGNDIARPAGDPGTGSLDSRKVAILNTLTANLKDLIARARSVPNVDRVAVCTALPRDMSLSSGAGYLFNGESPEVSQAAYNDLAGRYTAWLNDHRDELNVTIVDVNAASELQDPTDPRWYAYGAVPTPLGNDRLVRVVASKLTGPPQVVTAVVSPGGTALTIAFDRPIVMSAVPTAFVVTVDGAPRAVTSATATATTVILTLAAPVFTGKAVAVSATAGVARSQDDIPSNAFVLAAVNGSLQTDPDSGPGTGTTRKPRPLVFPASRRGYPIAARVAYPPYAG